MKTIVKIWFLLALVITGTIGLLYAAVQQDLRRGADDPQIQMAEDIAAKLADGQQAQNVVPSEVVDIARSLAPYVIVFDAAGRPVASSVQLSGRTPTVPAGVFDYVRQHGEDRITWQPQEGVRSAVVVTQFKGATSGFVLAGRSLREVEAREDDIGHLLLIGWSGMLLGTFLVTALLFRRAARNKE